ncbi:MAG: hypothetical protein IJX62_09355 [Clostridia bacterium]|nr:hypothetical protein [Clostridia bacterium]
METEFQKAVGKSVGEVARDMEEFLSCSCIVHPQKQIDLCTLLPNLNMYEQFSYALLNEALTQGWDEAATESFYRRACGTVISEEISAPMLEAFRQRDGQAWKSYGQRYGNRFSMNDGSYWSTCLALGIDAEQIGDVLYYLRLFTVCLIELAYMEDHNPPETYTWKYYESFRKMLDDLTAEPDPDPLPLKVRALGGTAGKREQDSYALSLGLDIENPNTDRMARDVRIDVTLKDKECNVIANIGDRLACLDPGVVYHYGITRKIRGAAVASIAATAKADSHLKLSTPIMKHVTLEDLRLSDKDGGTRLLGVLNGKYDRPLRSLTLHYQFLSADNKILGGGNEWIADGLAENGSRELNARVAVRPQNAAKVVYSIDFDAMELID